MTYTTILAWVWCAVIDIDTTGVSLPTSHTDTSEVGQSVLLVIKGKIIWLMII
jgi:hypothetical protein